jgi:hypothetical protein
VIRNHLLPPFGACRLEDITEQEVDRWARRLGADRPLSNATKRKVIVIFHDVMARARRVYGLPVDPVAKVERRRLGDVHGLRRASSSRSAGGTSTSPAHTFARPRATRTASCRPQERQGAVGADGVGGRGGVGASRTAQAIRRPRRPRLRRPDRSSPRRVGVAASVQRCTPPAYARCASTTCATRSARA